MIDVLHASVIVPAITHITTLGLLAADLRQARPLGTSAAVALGGGAAVLGTAVASMYVPVSPAGLAGALCVASSSATWACAATSSGRSACWPGRASSS